ncbi:MAG: hypothetical protein AAF514_14450 [Verrucomicrobiota bacterium]
MMRARGEDHPVVDLKIHFHRVLEILRDSEDESLRIAYDRSERISEDLPENQRNRDSRWRDLKEQRQRQIHLLQTYADRGVFPINDYQTSAVPVFVDRANTACAMGYLIRCSGHEALVRQTALENRFVCLEDVPDGPIVDWVLQSGLTIEEARLIQPAYRRAPCWQMPLKELEDSHALRSPTALFKVSDFKWNLRPTVSSFTKESPSPLVATMDRYQPSPFEGESPVSASPNVPWFLTMGTDFGNDCWSLLGVSIDANAFWLQAKGSREESREWEYEFRLGARRDAFFQRIGIATGNWEFNHLPLGREAGRIRIETTFFDSDETTHPIGSVVLDSNEPDQVANRGIWSNDWRKSDIIEGSDSVALDFVRVLRVKTRVKLWGEAVFRTLTYSVHPLAKTPATTRFTGRKKGRMDVDERDENTVSGGRYFFMRSTTLKPKDWVIVDQQVRGQNKSFYFDDSESPDRQIFYQILHD